MPSNVAAKNRMTGCWTRRWTEVIDLARVALVPMPVERFGNDPELDEEIAREVFRFRFPALLPPEAQQGGLVIAHDDPGV